MALINSGLKQLTILIIALTIALPASAVAWDKEFHSELTMLSIGTLRFEFPYNRNDVYYGSREPDEGKTFLGIGHSNTAGRSQQAFKAACDAARRGDIAGAARNLAHSMHYLQDRGDPTKELDNLFRRIFGAQVR